MFRSFKNFFSLLHMVKYLHLDGNLCFYLFNLSVKIIQIINHNYHRRKKRKMELTLTRKTMMMMTMIVKLKTMIMMTMER